MEIKQDNRRVVTGRTICMVAGILAAICAIYWIVKAIFFDQTNLPAILSSACIGLYLTMFAGRRSGK